MSKFIRLGGREEDTELEDEPAGRKRKSKEINNILKGRK
jgi:hypothetical protein